MAQGKNILDVRTNGAFIMNDSLLVDFRQQKLAGLLEELNSLQLHLEVIVRRALQDDNRLVGQEKANIVKVLHMLVRNLVSLYCKIFDADNSEAFPNDLVVSEGKDGYLVHGKMHSEQVNVDFSIETWSRDFLEVAIANLTRAFKDAAADHKFTLEERVGLIKIIAEMLLQSIQAFYLLRTGAVFK
jgi:hypothetical protein